MQPEDIHTLQADTFRSSHYTPSKMSSALRDCFGWCDFAQNLTLITTSLRFCGMQDKGSKMQGQLSMQADLSFEALRSSNNVVVRLDSFATPSCAFLMHQHAAQERMHSACSALIQLESAGDSPFPLLFPNP